MCGIFGYVGDRDPLTVCLSGLMQLEYRGYDSTGIAGLSKGSIAFCKRAGKLSFLKEKLILPHLDLAIAHTRWATHGKVNDENAHPHLDESGSVALIHNGIIENYAELREELLSQGTHFASETDSEIVANLIAKSYRGNLVEAMHQALAHLRGIFAFVAIHKDHPGEMVAAARECPLSIGYNEKKTESMISSDPNTFLGDKFHILFLRGDEIAKVTRGKVEVFDAKLFPIHKKTETLEIDVDPPSKGKFEHFMLKEIFEQPFTVQKALLGRKEDSSLLFDELKLDTNYLRRIKNGWILGCGTSSHAGLLGSMLMEELARFPTTVEIASEARYRTPLIDVDTLIIPISQSGETADTVAAMREAKTYGCKALALCNVKNSTLTREADAVLFLKAGPEVSVCSTKAFTSQLTLLHLLTLHLAQIRQTMSPEKLEAYFQELQKVPSLIQQVLDRAPEIEKLAQKYAQYDNFFFMGRRYMYPTCLEAALKLKEISYVNANGYPAGELKHGPIALLHSRFPVIAFCTNEKTREKIGSNLAEVKARGAPVLAISSHSDISSVVDDTFLIPPTLDELAPFPATIFGQLFAYYIAKKRGCDIDQPRNLAKSVTVE